MNEMFFCNGTPIGTLQVTIENAKVTGIAICEGSNGCSPQGEQARAVAREIDEYLRGIRKRFTFAVSLKGTPFQQAVWRALLKIPYGTTATYGNIAARIGKPKATRAVGMACNRNPLLLAVPCHRVVGAGGKLTGFAAGVERKKFLLKLENAM